MRKGPAEKVSISLPQTLYLHAKSKVRENDLQGLSEYVQQLIREDIKRDKRRMQRIISQSEELSSAEADLLAGRVEELGPETMNSVVEATVKRIMETNRGKGSNEI